MNFTSRMAALLAQMHRQRNGAVAAAMRFYGTPCGLNYGVSLFTVRQIARADTPDHDFARYLYLQDVRELRLAALHLADPERLAPEEFAAWGAGIVNSEIAEEAAFSLLNRARVLPELFRTWVADPNALLCYAALMAAARSSSPSTEWIEPALEAVKRWAAAEISEAKTPSAAVTSVSWSAVRSESDTAMPLIRSAEADNGLPAVSATWSEKDVATEIPAYAAHLTAQGAVALLAALGTRNEENRQAVLRAAGSLGKLPTEDFVHEELAWRLEA